MTGRYPVRSGYVARSIEDPPVTVSTTAKGGLPPNETTFATLLKRRGSADKGINNNNDHVGYTNGFFGKWHLGVHCGLKDFCHHPLNHGFDYYFGMPLTNVQDCGIWPIYALQYEMDEFAPSEMKELIKISAGAIVEMLIFIFLLLEFSDTERQKGIIELIVSLVLFVLMVRYAFKGPMRKSVHGVTGTLLLGGIMMKFFYVRRHRLFFRSRKAFNILLRLIIIVPIVMHVFQVARFFAHRQLNCVVMRNRDVVQQPVRLEQLTADLVDEANAFIERNHQDNDKSFLAFVSFHKAHTALATTPQFTGKSTHGSYGDTIMELDWAVGEILSTLDRLNLTDNTVVLFTSDHGPARYIYDESTGEYQGGWPGIYRGGKSNNYEGGIRVPMVVQWPHVLSPGLEIDRVTSHLDLFPTLLSMTDTAYNGYEHKDIKDGDNNNANSAGKGDISVLDGMDITNNLKGNEVNQPSSNEVPYRVLFHYCGVDIHAVTIDEKSRHDNNEGTVWKVHFMVARPELEGGFASCYGSESIINLGFERPTIYDLIQSPSEDQPLKEDALDYARIRDLAVRSALAFNRTVDYSVPNQLSREMNSGCLFTPERAPCCGGPYPFCHC